jgi:cellulose synthase/poly-beta-1,6-N-acetylglucosamine synthase-like glycosyltransferase
MFHSSNNKVNRFRWVGGAAPTSTKRVALLIPQFNENSNGNFERRLRYFQYIKEQYDSVLDTIIIDDGSTDDSLSRLQQFTGNTPSPFYVASVFPNADKVGALYATILTLSHEFIILSDFDTDLYGMEQLFDTLDMLRGDNAMMGGYFRMLPYEGAGTTFRFQQLEYALLRSLYRYHRREQSIPVMPGAGCCYKRNVLISIYEKHSGLRSGEDREATLLGLKMGYKTAYISDVTTLTRPPLSFPALIRQRTRWYLGYIETLNKERLYYRSQVRQRTAMGIRTILELLTVLLILSLAPVLLLTTIFNPLLTAQVMASVYLSYTVGCLYLIFTSPAETGRLTFKTSLAVLLFPFMKVSLEYISWLRALIAFRKKRRSYVRDMPRVTDIYVYRQAARQLGYNDIPSYRR